MGRGKVPRKKRSSSLFIIEPILVLSFFFGSLEIVMAENTTSPEEQVIEAFNAAAQKAFAIGTATLAEGFLNVQNSCIANQEINPAAQSKSGRVVAGSGSPPPSQLAPLPQPPLPPLAPMPEVIEDSRGGNAGG